MAARADGNALLPPENAIMAVPKKGRLYEQCVRLLAGAGLEHKRPARVDIAQCTNLPLTLVFLPAHDIASYVGDGNVDIGITGLDVVEETEGESDMLDVVMELGFGKCRLCVQAPIDAGITNVAQLSGKRIVTSFPRLCKRFFDEIDQPGKPTSIKYVSGSVEAACGLGLADGVVDLVETGTTMKAAGLDVVGDVMQSQCLLIANKHTKHRKLVDVIVSRIRGWITAEQHVLIQYNVERKNLEAATRLTPGKRSPTVSQLEEEGWVAVSALIKKQSASQVMDDLTDVGATDILILGISNSRM
ncbi:unnamed protein product [Phaeothamnion confervicola]